MGLTSQSTGKSIKKKCNITEKIDENDLVVALVGNPNVGKSTVFNALTGLNQHTGNWSGKTVSSAKGRFEYGGKGCTLIDTPGCYSLMSRSAEEIVTRDYICFGSPDAIIVVCDACCLERNLILAVQILQITSKVIICINMMDEAKKKGIKIDAKKIEAQLNVPVVCVSGRNRIGLNELKKKVFEIKQKESLDILFDEETENAISIIYNSVSNTFTDINTRWLCIKLLERDPQFIESLKENYKIKFDDSEEYYNDLQKAREYLHINKKFAGNIYEQTVTAEVTKAKYACENAVLSKNSNFKNITADKIISGKIFAFPIMLLLVALVFWITIIGANYPSKLLSSLLLGLEDEIYSFLVLLKINKTICNCLVYGVYRVVSWIVSVMLPPMAIFFPMFTLLEDAGYLPRVAFNIDRCFNKCKTCGKQALTMCMGFGCNAAGVVGCRIINSERERLIAILTNSFVPCNGRFPILISIITMFFVINKGSFYSAIYLTLIIVLSIMVTLITSKILSSTLLKGEASSFTLELPPYRKPQFLRVIIRSLLDRTIYILGRAVVAALPAGLIIWLLSNITVDSNSLLAIISSFLDPFGRLIGLDGVILLAFILGIPANEIVIPIIIMAYTAEGAILNIDNLIVLKHLFIENGWTSITAICFIIFTLFHWPCATTLITIKKETNSIKWTALSFVLPLIIGVILCFSVAQISKLI